VTTTQAGSGTDAERGGLTPTPSQTVGPFYGYALPLPHGEQIAPVGDPRTITVHGTVYDGDGQPVPDALIEVWQADPEGDASGRPGSIRRDTVTGRVQGRDGLVFTGFGRVATDPDGHWLVRTLPPGARPGATLPYLAVIVFARGLLYHLHTRVYLPDQIAAAGADDALLGSLEPERRATLIAEEERPGQYRFDIRLQQAEGGPEETVFLDFTRS